jgi:hypothetical protein
LIAGGNGRDRGKGAGGGGQSEADGLVRGLIDRLRRGKEVRGEGGAGQGAPYPDGAIDVPGLDVPEREE